LREAQAMARLSHPNVASVFDVGTFGADVFVAMELVEGTTLKQWLKGQPRSIRDVLAVFVQAGRGIEAAHERGLVHRDFKPDNVIVDSRGRARVLDFGLARVADWEPPGHETRAPAGPAPDLTPSSGTPLGAELTRTGTLMGTPAYMSPEQWHGEVADERSDQFSFCVALYEALYGERPFDAASAALLGAEVTNGNVRKPPAGSPVPGWLRTTVVRGLAVDKAERHPSMGALLKALGQDPTRTRRRWIAAGAAVVSVLALAQGFRLGARHRSGLCKGSEQQLVGVWDAPRRQAVQAAFLRTGKGFAQDAFVGAARALDEYAHRWVAMRQEACEATRVRGEQSEELLDLRMECLGQRREEVRALVDLFTQADGEIVTKAVQAASGVGELSSCANATALRAPIRPPANPQVQREVESLRAKLARAKALGEAGKSGEGLAFATTLADEAKRVGYRPVEAEAMFRLGDLRIDSAAYEAAALALFDAAALAEAAHHDEIAAQAWISLAWLAVYQGRFPEGHRWTQLASAKLDRVGSLPRDENSLLRAIAALLGNEGKHAEALAVDLRSLAIVEKALGPEHTDVAASLEGIGLNLNNQGKYEEALGYHRRALAMRERILGSEHPFLAKSLTSIGEVLENQGKYEEALGYHRRALAIRQKALGQEHPDVASVLFDIGDTLWSQGKYQEALGYHRRALAIYEKLLGPDSPDVASSLSSIGALNGELGKYDEELGYMRRALAIQEKLFGTEHPNLAKTLVNIGMNFSDRGKYEEAIAQFRRSLAILEKMLGTEHPDLSWSLNDLGDALWHQGKYQEALGYHRRALAIQEKALGPEHPDLRNSLTGLGKALLGLGTARSAVAPLERALLLAKRTPDRSNDVAEAEFALARALWDSAQDRARAKTLAAEALAAYKAAGLRGRRDIPIVEAWLARHGRAQ
jgi:tetratricopeptide (TPR) repeat protein